jgi:hypothetical protein
LVYNGHMNIQLQNNSHILNMDLEDAFALQAALTEAIRRITKVTTDCALRGAKVTRYGAGETVGPLTYEHNGRPYPSSLTVFVTVGEPE